MAPNFDFSKRQSKVDTKYDPQKANIEVMLRTLKDCYKDARQEVDYLRKSLNDALKQTEEYKMKYSKILQQTEEQKRQLEVQDMDNARVAEQINLEILCIRQKYNEKLRELEPYPELLQKTEKCLNAEKEKNAKAEHAIDVLTTNLNIARERVHMLMHTMVQVPEDTDDDILRKKEIELQKQKNATLQYTINKLKLEIESLKSKIIMLEERELANDKRLMDKVQECVVLGGVVDQTRVEANEALDRMNKRFEVTQKKLELEIDDLKHKLKMVEKKLIATEKEKDKVEDALESKIFHMNESAEKARLRILELMAKVKALQQVKSDDDDEPDEPCVCGTIFADPVPTKV